MKLYISRHGESEANRLQVISNRDLCHPLTEKGRRQAEALAKRLAGLPICKIYCSPLQRAYQTGEIIAVALSVPLELAEALREPDCGVLEGRSDAEAWEEHSYWMKTWLAGYERDRGPQGGESYTAVRKRMAGFLHRLVTKYGASPADFLLVTHGEAMLFGLPGVVEGLDVQYILDHGLEHANILCVEVKQDNLLLLE